MARPYGCRDCGECTSSLFRSFVLFFFRWVWPVLLAWNVGLFMRRCPRCQHHLALHATKGGVYVD